LPLEVVLELAREVVALKCPSLALRGVMTADGDSRYVELLFADTGASRMIVRVNRHRTAAKFFLTLTKTLEAGLRETANRRKP
jgi:hypothetical protein